jgi:hypothetical protein
MTAACLRRWSGRGRKLGNLPRGNNDNSSDIPSTRKKKIYLLNNVHQVPSVIENLVSGSFLCGDDFKLGF